MKRTLISSGSPYENIIGFSRAVRVGNIVAVGGTAPIGLDGKTIGKGDAGAQTHQCIEIIKTALEKAGAICDIEESSRPAPKNRKSKPVASEVEKQSQDFPDEEFEQAFTVQGEDGGKEIETGEHEKEAHRRPSLDILKQHLLARQDDVKQQDGPEAEQEQAIEISSPDSEG